MKLRKHRILLFQNTIFSWWKKHHRDLPWRHTSDPYRIWISEVMLQQTQVLRVLPKYSEFIKAYPTVESLAASSPGDVLRVWQGMGYNRRAIYLHRAANFIVHEYHSKFPISEQKLSQLPGVGKYTARALLIFAFKKNIYTIDINIRRIILHFFFYDIPQKPAVIEEVAGQLVPKGKSWEWHQALMDYGALALPRSVNHVPKTRIPFHESDRFYRGRIIDRLRVGSVKRKEFILELVNRYGKTELFFTNIISVLQKEELIVSSGGQIGLPE